MIDLHNAMLQAPMTIEMYLDGGIKVIDRHLGIGYAKEHPELLAAFIKGCCMDFQCAVYSNRSEILELKND